MTDAVVVVDVMSVQPGSDILTVLHSAGSAADAATGHRETLHSVIPAAIRQAVLKDMFNLPVSGWMMRLGGWLRQPSGRVVSSVPAGRGSPSRPARPAAGWYRRPRLLG